MTFVLDKLAYDKLVALTGLVITIAALFSCLITLGLEIASASTKKITKEIRAAAFLCLGIIGCTEIVFEAFFAPDMLWKGPVLTITMPAIAIAAYLTLFPWRRKSEMQLSTEHIETGKIMYHFHAGEPSYCPSCCEEPHHGSCCKN